MKVHVATDHAGLEFKTKLIGHLSSIGYEVIDHGAHEYNPADDYPGFIIAAAEAVANDQRSGIESLGVVFGGSGNGEQMAANKVKGIRAALVWNEFTARKAREHNDANVISIGARQHSEEEALQLIDFFLKEPFSGDERHVRRIGQIAAYEQSSQQKSKSAMKKLIIAAIIIGVLFIVWVELAVGLLDTPWAGS